MKKICKKYWFVICVLTLCVIKQILVTSLPIFARDSMGPDQYKLLTDAEDIWNGQYIYNNAYGIFALFKRAVSFPVFLAICHWIGLSYLAGYTLLYTVACVFAMYALRQYIDNKGILLTAFAILLFVPFSYDYVVQMVYNLSFTAPLAIGAISCLVIAYAKRNSKWYVTLAWMLVAAIYLTGIWLNREDSMWIIPLIAVFLLVVSVALIRNYNLIGIKTVIGKLMIFALPIFFVVVGNIALSYVNYMKYGIFTTNDYTDTNFESAYNSLLEIEQSGYAECCSITQDMLERAYEVSPSLAQLKPYMDQFYELGTYDKNGVDPEDGEIEDSLMNIALRDAASQAGYYQDAVSTNEFWGQVDEELQCAFDEGRLASRSMTFFGSTMHHPWRSGAGYASIWAKSVYELLRDDILHVFAEPQLTYNQTQPEVTARYEAMTLNYTVDKPQYIITVAGWILPNEYVEKFQLQLVDENNVLVEEIELVDSPDIGQGLPDNVMSSKCRFEVSINLETLQNLYIKVLTDKAEMVIPLQNDVIYNDFTYHFDIVEQRYVNDADEIFATKRVQLAVGIARIYQILGPIMAIIFLLGYIYKTWRLLRTISSKEYEFLDEWIFQTSILGCTLVLLVAISFVDAFMWGALFYTHTIGTLLDFAGVTGIAIDGSYIYNRVIKAKRMKEIE